MEFCHALFDVDDSIRVITLPFSSYVCKTTLSFGRFGS